MAKKTKKSTPARTCRTCRLYITPSVGQSDFATGGGLPNGLFREQRRAERSGAVLIFGQLT